MPESLDTLATAKAFIELVLTQGSVAPVLRTQFESAIATAKGEQADDLVAFLKEILEHAVAIDVCADEISSGETETRQLAALDSQAMHVEWLRETHHSLSGNP